MDTVAHVKNKTQLTLRLSGAICHWLTRSRLNGWLKPCSCWNWWPRWRL